MLEKVDISGEYLLPKWNKLFSQHILHQICVGTAGHIPCQLHEGVPALQVGLASLATQVVQHEAIGITSGVYIVPNLGIYSSQVC